MRHFYIEQGSDEWLEQRCGFITASNFSSLVTTTGTKSRSWKTYINKVIAEADVPKPIEAYQSDAMKQGVDREDLARSRFELLYNVNIKQVGMIALDDYDVSCSPDGLFSDTGVEIKCPQRHTFAGYVIDNKLPTTYFQQIQGTMWICELDYYWFYAYSPEHGDLKIKVLRDDEWINSAAKIITEAATYVKEGVKKLKCNRNQRAS